AVTRERHGIIDSAVRVAFRNNKTLPGYPWQGFESTLLNTLVAGRSALIRGRRGNAGDAHCNHSNHAGRGSSPRTSTTPPAPSCATRLRHRVPRECRKENHRYKLLHETPQIRNTSLIPAAH